MRGVSEVRKRGFLDHRCRTHEVAVSGAIAVDIGLSVVSGRESSIRQQRGWLSGGVELSDYGDDKVS